MISTLSFVTAVANTMLFPKVYLFAIMQASGSMSPRMQLLRERAAIHGSIAHVRFKHFFVNVFCGACSVERTFAFCVLPQCVLS